MTGRELTLIREAPFSSPELSSNTQGCRHGRLYQDLDHHVPDCSIWTNRLSKRQYRFHPCRLVRPRREEMGEVYFGPAGRILSLVEVEHVKD